MWYLSEISFLYRGVHFSTIFRYHTIFSLSQGYFTQFPLGFPDLSTLDWYFSLPLSTFDFVVSRDLLWRILGFLLRKQLTPISQIHVFIILLYLFKEILMFSWHEIFSYSLKGLGRRHGNVRRSTICNSGRVQRTKFRN